jgi:hypothetical protein
VIIEIHHEVTGLLGHPFPCRVGGDARQVHPPDAVLNEEQHVEATQEHGAGVKEVRRKDRPGLGVPRPANSPWMRRYPQPGLSRAIAIRP